MLTQDYLKDNKYPGRLICAGVTPRGAITYAYAITGRSPNSRNRILAVEGNRVVTRIYDQSQKGDSSLTIYPAIIRSSLQIIIANGDHSLIIQNDTDHNLSLEKSMENFTFEPDAPHYTPRIALVIRNRRLNFAIASRSEDGTCERRIWSYPLEKGVLRMIHTYDRDGVILPSFSTAPVQIDAESNYAPILWNALDPENRVSLFVMEGHKETIFNARELERQGESSET